MLALFRRIRQELLTKSKAGSYLKYAIGEIVLVVIGILIALSINNWNESRKLKIWEHQFLVDLRTDLQNDSSHLAFIIDFQSHKLGANQKLLAVLENPQPADKTLIDSLFYLVIAGNDTFFPKSSVYESAVTSGKMENITNKELKYSIMTLYNHYYVRLQHNGDIYDERVETVAWARKEYFDKVRRRIRTWDQAQSLEVYTHAEFLNTENEIYVDMARNMMTEIVGTLTLIDKELGN